jgi:putative transcriptional regulator
MNKKPRKPDIGSELIAGMENALAHARGRKRAARESVIRVRVPERIDVAALRRRLGMSQAAFAARFGFSVKNIQNWEQGSRQPEGPARAYLLVIDRNPKAVQEALAKAS